MLACWVQRLTNSSCSAAPAPSAPTVPPFSGPTRVLLGFTHPEPCAHRSRKLKLQSSGINLVQRGHLWPSVLASSGKSSPLPPLSLHRGTGCSETRAVQDLLSRFLPGWFLTGSDTHCKTSALVNDLSSLPLHIWSPGNVWRLDGWG